MLMIMDEVVNREGDWSPRLQKEFVTLDDAWRFYQDYARKCGFAVRKEYFNKSKRDGIVTSQLFVCSKAGELRKDKRCKTGVHRFQTKTKCKAKLNVSFSRKIEKYVVKEFIEEHNHVTEPIETNYMSKSNRHAYEAHSVALDMVHELVPVNSNTHQMGSANQWARNIQCQFNRIINQAKWDYDCHTYVEKLIACCEEYVFGNETERIELIEKTLDVRDKDLLNGLKKMGHIRHKNRE